MKIEYKVVPVVGQKVLDEAQGIVGQFVSVTGVVDSVKDRIIPGAYQKTLIARTPKGVWSHDWDKPVSKTLAAEELLPGDDRLPKTTRTGEDWPSKAGALYVETQYNLETQRGREAFSDVKFYGDQQEYSIGYNVPPGASKVDNKTGIRELSYIDLYEYSPVLFGAMSLTQTAGVKDAQEAWKVQVKEGEATEGQVAILDREDELVVQGTPHAQATEMLNEAMNPKPVTPTEAADPGPTPVAEGFTEVTDATPVTTPADTIYTDQQGSTGSGAGVTVEQRPEAPKSAVDEFVENLPDEVKAQVTAWMATQEATEAKASVTLTGSYEERQDALRKVLRNELADEFNLDGEDEWGYSNWWVTTEATFNNRVVAVAYDMEGGDVRYFEASYSFDGQVATLKNPREVRIEATVASKNAQRASEMRSAWRLMQVAKKGAPEGEVPLNLIPDAQEDGLDVITEADLMGLERLKLVV